MTVKTPSELIGNNLKLLSLPTIIEKINHVLEDPNSSASDIAHYIGQDPTLTARLLKLVNSPFYNFPSEIDSITMAVTILGTRQLRDLVFVTTIVNQFKSARRPNFDIEAFWCHSITTALAARVIASNQKSLNSERLFIGGLLHDIGKMVMAIVLPDQTDQMLEALLDKNADLHTIEKHIYGHDHGKWAMALLDAWHFPRSISEPIQYHHDPEKCPEHITDCSVLNIANVIANNIQAPFSSDDDTLVKTFALETIGITLEQMEAYYEQVYNLLDDVLKTLYYDVAA